MSRDRKHWNWAHKTVGFSQVHQGLASCRMWRDRWVPFSISDIKVPSHVQQVGDIQSCIRQEVHSSVKIVQVDVHEKLAPASVKEGQELDVSVVDYVSPESKAKSGQSRMDKAHNSGCLLRALWRPDHLGPLWVNRSTNNFITSRGSSRWCKANKVPGRFLDK